MSVGWAVFGKAVFSLDDSDLIATLARAEQDFWQEIACGRPAVECGTHDEAKEWAFNAGEVMWIEED